MLDFLSNLLTAISNWQGLTPAFSLLLAVTAGVISFLTSADAWAGIVLAVSLAFAFLSWAHSHKRSLAAFGFALVSAWVIPGLDTSLGALQITHLGCVTIAGNTADECIEQFKAKAEVAGRAEL